MVAPAVITPATPTLPAEKIEQKPEEKKEEKKTDGSASVTPNRARLIVELPADAKLFIDDHAMKATSSTRSFQTPTLEPGERYYYMVRVEMVRDGRTMTAEKKVVVKAGEVARTSFDEVEMVASR